jgi:trehalose/maltose hydrolase-like predicted phosphorylase
LKALIEGFGGIKCLNGNLSIEPNLPKKWENLEFDFYFKNIKINYSLTKDKIILKTSSDKEISLTINGKEYKLNKKLEI